MKRRPKKTLAAQMRIETNRTLQQEKKKKFKAKEGKKRLDAEARQQAPEVGREIYKECLEKMRSVARIKETTVSVLTKTCDTMFEDHKTLEHETAVACIHRLKHAADYAVALLTEDGSLEAKWDIHAQEFVPSGSDPMYPYRFTTFCIRVHISW